MNREKNCIGIKAELESADILFVALILQCGFDYGLNNQPYVICEVLSVLGFKDFFVKVFVKIQISA